MRAFWLLLVVCCASACTTRLQWGLPRVPVSATSPDGRFVAFVRNHPNPDPWDQSLWIRNASGTEWQVGRVPPDAFWCDRIAWSADSRRVAFVVADAIVHVYDARTRERVFAGFVNRRSWDVPPRFILRDFVLSADGRAAFFRECERTYHPVNAARQNAHGTRVAATIGNCSAALRTVAFESIAADNRW
jgi:hypothetical protein